MDMPMFDTPTAITATIDIVAGDIRVVASDRTDTLVEVRPRDASRELDAKTATETRVEYADGKLIVKSPKPLQVYFTGRSTNVDVTVELPTGSHVTGTTADGDIYCAGSLGDCRFRTYDGDIGLHRTGSLRATTMNGRIIADRVGGPAHVTGSGDVQLTEVAGAANVKNLNGPSWIGQVAGDVHVNSAHGDISIDRAGPQVVARTAHGSVRLGEIARGSVVLQTASGDIEVGIRHGTAAWLDVKSSAGSVHNRLEAGAGPDGPEETAQVRARTLDGDIIIRRAG
jgi:DUF4097 and DUF4098 domain-containing protein YvlB